MSEPLDRKEEGLVSRALATAVFWWLTVMGMGTLALAATIPLWVEYRQAVQVREQARQQVIALQQRVDRNNYLIKAYTEDPEAIDMLAIADLRYRRPDETAVPLPRTVLNQIRPVAWNADGPADGILTDKQQNSAPPPNAIEQYVERGKSLSKEYLGPARTVGLVEMFSDPTCRRALTTGALAVLAAALFLCRPAPAGEEA